MSCVPGTPSSCQPQPLSQPLPPCSPTPPSHLHSFLMPFPPPVMPSVSPPCPSPLPPAPPPAQLYFRFGSKSFSFWDAVPPPSVQTLSSQVPYILFFLWDTFDLCLYFMLLLLFRYSVMSDSLWPSRSPPGSFCPWDFPGKNTGVGCYFLLQGIFPTQGLNPCLLHCR